jgi:AcrR family transcriptional regulator
MAFMKTRKHRLEQRKRPLQKRSKASVEEILSTAAQIFESDRWAPGTTDRIAARAGVSIGTRYQYFPGKEAAAVALLERHIADADHRLHPWVGSRVAEPHGLRAALRQYVIGMLETSPAGRGFSTSVRTLKSPGVCRELKERGDS